MPQQIFALFTFLSLLLAGCSSSGGDGAPGDPTDSTPPNLSAGSPSGQLSASTSQVLMSIASDEHANCRHGIQPGVSYADLPEVFSSTGGTSHSTTVNGLVDDQLYTFYVRCEDAAGNANPSDYTIRFSTASPSADTQPPTRSNGAPTGVLASGTQSAELSLTTDENATCRYGTTPGQEFSQLPDQFNGTGGTSHASTVSGLSDGQQYVYFVRCEDFSSNANDNDYEVRFSVAQPSAGATVSDNFDGNGSLLNYTTNNASALPEVARVNGRYRAELTDNTNNKTLHYHGDQGRLDAKIVSFPFEYIARNIGIGTIADSQSPPPATGSPYIFAGIQVHVLDLDSRNSAHFVVGHRGSTYFTAEGKNTVNGSSSVNDDGANILPEGRADLRVVGQADRSLKWYWQRPNPNPGVQADSWNAYRGDGDFPGNQASFGSQVYIGLITYAYNQAGIPFVGTADSVELVGE